MKRARKAQYPLLIHRCTVAIGDGLPTEFRIWKAGVNSTVNGYSVQFDEAAAKTVMAAYQAHGVEIMIDLEHLSLDSEAKHFDPDARGWCKLAVRDGELWAVDVRWTPDGEHRLSVAKSQRYISPAFLLDDDGRPTRLLNIALVAMPGTDQLEALVAASEKGTRSMKITIAKALESAAYARKLSRRGVAPGMVVRALAEGDGGDSGGEVAGVDIAALAEFLGIAVDPAQDPAGFVREILAKLEEISGKLRGDAPAEPPADEAAPAEEMAAAKAIMRVVAAKSATDALITVTEWRTLALEHAAQVRKLEAEKAALEATKVRQLTARLVACGAETPATAWADDDKTQPAKHIRALSVAELEQRCQAFEARGQTKRLDADKGAAASDVTQVTVSGVVVSLSAEEVKRCKARGADLERYAEIKLRQGRTAPVTLEG